VNLLEDNIDTIKKNTESLTDTSKDVGLEVNAEKVLLFRYRNAGQNHYIKIAKRPFENVAQFKYLGTTTAQHFIHDEITRRFNFGNVCCHSDLELFVLSSTT
jgi:hypothetical protein